MSDKPLTPETKRCPVPHDLHHLHPKGVERIKQIRAIREKLIENNGDIQIDLKGDRTTLKDTERAVESLILNYTWEYAISGRPLPQQIPHDEHFWLHFSFEMEAYLYQAAQRFYEAVIARINALPDEDPELTMLDRLMVHHHKLNELLEDQFTLPFLSDLSMVVTQMIRVLHEAYEERYQEPLSRAEFLRFVSNPDFERALFQLQLNASAPVQALQSRLQDPTRLTTASREGIPEEHPLYEIQSREKILQRITPFNPDHFFVDRDEHTFGILPELVEQTIAETDDAIPMSIFVRNCPVVYMQSFHEMMQWLIRVVLHQRYGDAYPEPGETPRETRLPALFQQRIQTEIRETVLPYLKTTNS